MNSKTTYAFGLVQQALSKYTDIPDGGIQMDTALLDLQIDSLTLAELLFELEDSVGTSISDVATPPKLVGELVALVEPFIGDEGFKTAA